MKYLKRYGSFLNEELTVLKPYSDEETDAVLNEMTPDEALEWSIKNNQPEYIKKAVERGADINIQGKNGNTLLINAILDNNSDMVKILIDLGADVNIKNNYGCTALYVASTNNIDMVKMLINAGADVNIINNNHVSILFHAIDYKKTDIAKLLINAGAR